MLKITHASVAALIAISLSTASIAKAAMATYDVRHNFNFAPGGNIIPQATHTWGNNTDAQPGGVTCLTSGSQAFGGGGGAADHACASVGAGSSADSHTNATVNGFGVGGPVTGSIRSDGQATAVGNSSAFASSFSRVSVQGGTQMKNGRIVWGPRLSSFVSGSARAGKRDPIFFEVLDLDTSAILNGTLLDILIDMPGPGSFDWDGSMFSVNALEFDFALDMTSPFTTQQGTANLQISGGVITNSTTTGVFAGLFPAVGTSGNFSVPFGDITLDYDLGDFNGHDLNVGFDFGGSGNAAAAVPEPSAFVLMAGGIVSLLAYRRFAQVSRKPHC